MSDTDTDEKLAALEARLKTQEDLVAKLIEIFVGKGALTEGHRKLLTKLAKSSRRVQLPQVQLGSPDDKYKFAGAEIDCASRLHLCGARCCRLEAPLGQQDLDERSLEWETRRPYIIKRAEDGYCAYLEESGGCASYDVRPTVCRKFDCREDVRIWQDFENMIPTPDVFIRIFPAPDES